MQNKDNNSDYNLPLRPADYTQPPRKISKREEENFSEKLEFLKREEIRTMQKDLARLREGEAQEERERIAGLTPDKREKEREKRLEIAEKEKEESREEKDKIIFLKRIEEEKEKVKKQKEKEEKEIKAFTGELIGLKGVLEETTQDRKRLESQKEDLTQKSTQIIQEISIILKKEKEIEEKELEIERKEEGAKNSTERQEAEKKRWQIQEERKKIESERWQKEKEQMEIKNRLEEINLKYREISERENGLKEKVKNIESFVKKPPEDEKLEKLMSLKERWKGKEEEKREIKTFEEKIKNGEGKIKNIVPEETREEKEIKEGLIPALPKKPPAFLGGLLRMGVIIIIIILIGGLVYWQFGQKNPQGEPSPQPVEPIEPVEPPNEDEPIVPPVLIKTFSTETLKISTVEEIPQALSQLLNKIFEKDVLIRILIENAENNKILGLKEFFEAFYITTPFGFLEKINNDFTLFIHSTGEQNRLGFIAEIEKKEELSNLLRSWEKTIEKDTENLFSVLGKKGAPLVSYFRQTSFKGKDFRFLTISKDDFGICYTLTDEYLIFTTSFGGMQKTINEIGSQKINKDIGQLFIIGFEGKNLTPDFEEVFKNYHPGGVLLLSKNIESEGQLKSLISDLQDLSLKETGLPLFIAVDQEGDPISRIGFLEEKTPQSEISSPQEAYQIGFKRGTELKSLGVNINLAPLLDNMRAEDFYFNRSFQKTPGVSGEIAKSLILGQKETGIFTAIKHFPGYVGVSFNPESKLAEINLPETSQFQKSMEASPKFVMTANAVYPEIDSVYPLVFSASGIQFLKNNLGSEFLIMSDDLAQSSLLNEYSINEVVTKPVLAGVDILIFSGWRAETTDALDSFYESYEKNEVSRTEVDNIASKIINFKQNFLQ